MNNLVTIVSDNLKKNSLAISNSSLIKINENADIDNLTESDYELISEGLNNNNRILHCSEIYEKLKQRGWNNVGLKFFDTSGNVKQINDIGSSYDSTGIITIDTENNNNSTFVSGKITSDNRKKILELYNEIFEKMNGVNEIYLYRASKNTVDLLEGTLTADLIGYDSDSYTNTLDIKELLEHSPNPKISSKVDLTMQYSKDKKIYTKDFTFEAFNCFNDSVTLNNIIEEIERDIVLEFINGVIKIMPKSEDVKECIICNCTITYGNLN